tara:strand:- start:79 stop:585 length:507 start_codon:yes stop_codon:yes gene_type:complete
MTQYKSEDGYTFDLQDDGSLTDGDMTFDSLEELKKHVDVYAFNPRLEELKKHVDSYTGKCLHNSDIILIGHCPVDSGQIMITDPCYLDKWIDNDYENEVDFHEFSYNTACHLTNTFDFSELPKLTYRKGGSAVVSRTGWGDGNYPVYAKICPETKRVMELKIIFIEEE